MSKEPNSADTQQTIPLLPPTTSIMNGLNALRTIDSLYVKQQPSVMEMVFGIASEAKFDIFNERNERIFQALETSTFCQRFCCSMRREFTLRILDNLNQEIILLKRQFKCCSGCSCCANIQCCSQEIVVESPPGTHIGTVSQIQACCRSVFEIKDAQDNAQLTLQGPFCICDGPVSCCCQTKFTLTGSDGVTEIGSIEKKYRGFLAEAMTSADAYMLRFPMDLDVRMKAVTLAALFLVEYMIFAAVPKKEYN